MRRPASAFSCLRRRTAWDGAFGRAAQLVAANRWARRAVTRGMPSCRMTGKPEVIHKSRFTPLPEKCHCRHTTYKRHSADVGMRSLVPQSSTSAKNAQLVYLRAYVTEKRGESYSHNSCWVRFSWRHRALFRIFRKRCVRSRRCWHIRCIDPDT